VGLVALHLSSALLAAPLQLFLLALHVPPFQHCGSHFPHTHHCICGRACRQPWVRRCWPALACYTPCCGCPGMVPPPYMLGTARQHLPPCHVRWLACTLFPVFAVGLMGAVLYATHSAIEHEGRLIAVISTVSLGIGLLVTQIKGLFFPAINILPPVDMYTFSSARTRTHALTFRTKDGVHEVHSRRAKGLGGLHRHCPDHRHPRPVHPTNSHYIIMWYNNRYNFCRIPALVGWVRSKESFKRANPYLTYCYKQLFYASVDYACLPFLLVVLMTMWRVPQLRRLWQANVRLFHKRIEFFFDFLIYDMI
jgi:hypothetical protein